MTTTCLTTRFAPAERAAPEDIDHQHGAICAIPQLDKFLNAVPEVFLIVNRQRQIVFANQALLNLLCSEDTKTVLGLRPGEALRCIHAAENPGGCGTAEACRTCGAAQTILTSLRGLRSTNECRITLQNGDALDLRVWGTPLVIDGDVFSMVAMKDISDEKRRQALERIFFHDILNVAGVLMGYAEMLQFATDAEEITRFKDTIYRASQRLIDEIEMQRALTAAENGELALHWGTVDSLQLLKDLQSFYQGHEVAHDRRIQIAPQAQGRVFISDLRLLTRVLGNMIKNALEASLPGQVVTLSCQASDQYVRFEVHNPMGMPREVELQMFQRSFSTKGAGRGLGTYSIKLLTERYLGGKVAFTTSPEAGTTFWATYPIQPDLPPSNGNGIHHPATG